MKPVRSASYEAAKTAAPPLLGLDSMLQFGGFQRRFCATFWVANLFAESAWYSAVSFVVLEVSGEWGLPAAQAGLYPVCLFTGQLFGSLFFGWLADCIGRRPVMLICMAVVSASGLACAFMPALAVAMLGPQCSYDQSPPLSDGCFVPLMGALFVQGFALGGTIPTYTALLTEFLPVEGRGRTVNMLMSSWTIGYAVVPLLGVFIMSPQGACYNCHLLGQSGWRMIYIVLCVFSSLVTLWLWVSVPESLRFLLLRGRRAEARQLLARMSRGGAIKVTHAVAEKRLGLHGSSWASPFDAASAAATADSAPSPSLQQSNGQMVAIRSAGRAVSDDTGGADAGSSGGQPQVRLQRAISNDQQQEQKPFGVLLRMLLCSDAMRRTTLCLWFIWFPISFAGNGFAVFLPMMQRHKHVPPNQVMWDNVIWASSGTIGILAGGCMLESEYLGRRRTLAIGLLGCALSYLAFALAETNASMVALSCLNNVANSVGWGALFTYTAEVHPTELRAFGCGSANMIKSLAGIGGPYFAGWLTGARGSSGGGSGSGGDGSGAGAGVVAGGVVTALVVFCAMDLIGCMAALSLPMETRGVVLAERTVEHNGRGSARDGTRQPLLRVDSEVVLP